MKRILLGRCLAALTAIAVLSDCSFASGVPSSPYVAGVAAEKSASGALLYVANGSAAAGVSIVRLPQGKPVATIANIGEPEGVCADSSGHVWITAYLSGGGFALYKFVRGATTPTRTVRASTFFRTCAVDPRGDVAVFAVEGAYTGTVEIWPPSLHGKPRVVRVAIDPVSGAYDARGNLYITGYTGSDLAFVELPKGSDKLTQLTLEKREYLEPGCLGWDGAHVTLGAYTRRGLGVIYRLTINGDMATVASIVRLRDLAPYPEYAFAGKTVVATRRRFDIAHAGLYDYPAGGKATAIFSGFYKPMQIAISSQ